MWDPSINPITHIAYAAMRSMTSAIQALMILFFVYFFLNLFFRSLNIRHFSAANCRLNDWSVWHVNISRNRVSIPPFQLEWNQYVTKWWWCAAQTPSIQKKKKNDETNRSVSSRSQALSASFEWHPANQHSHLCSLFLFILCAYHKRGMNAYN